MGGGGGGDGHRSWSPGHGGNINVKWMYGLKGSFEPFQHSTNIRSTDAGQMLNGVFKWLQHHSTFS